MNPTQEAVRAALAYADYQAGKAFWSHAIQILDPHIETAEQPAQAASRILASALRQEQARLDFMLCLHPAPDALTRDEVDDAMNNERKPLSDAPETTK